VAAITVYSAPEDGRKGRPKHVKNIKIIYSLLKSLISKFVKNVKG